MKVPRIVVAGTTSSVGKTSIAAAIIHGIKKKGYSVQPFKVGPDFIDPSYLTAVSGKSARNLDPWLMGSRGVLKSFILNSNSNFSVIEGVMGYYDGFSGDSNFASTHHVATILNTPVILILDASKTARSIAATALGFTKFHRMSRIVGFILNKIASKRHEELCRQALASLKLPILGVIPKNSDLKMRSRHLGLIPVTEQKSLQSKISRIARTMYDFIDIERIIQIGKNTTSLPQARPEKDAKQRTKIIVALDESFNFYYRDNFDALRREGAKIEFFSPVSDSKIDDCDGIYLGGGFPEVLGHALERNQIMRKTIKKLAENGIPIYAECGGLMYLTKSIDYDNKKFKMVGLFDATTKMQKKLKLNYTKATISNDCLIGKASRTIQGQEFHFSELEFLPKDSKFAYDLSIGVGIKNHKDGLMQYNTLASYMHMHFSRPGIAKNFVRNCIKYSRR
ncbi:MAG: hydrogenobyrinic acid a,c-diamide synthase (glutamine-hydrolyzing) [Thaumarchaeota archaeon]|nr:hydrogenobyrinic acid a,c-diamide synthase (glutamine-hydrolyzing) [Nitrososphaerota archaeon]